VANGTAGSPEAAARRRIAGTLKAQRGQTLLKPTQRSPGTELTPEKKAERAVGAKMAQMGITQD
jgi:hypothetical protein